jgi:purine-nucleoside phosphorylase
MEAAALFTLAAMRQVQAACFLTVSDVLVYGQLQRIGDDELRAAVDRMTTLALDVAVSEKH